MKRPRLYILASIVLAGRHCHPLGLLLAGLICVTLGSAGLSASVADAVTGRFV